MDVYYEGHICGDFEGFDEGKIFKLDDGSYWRQTEYEYEYDYEYEPPAQIIGEYGCFYLHVNGKKAAVEPIDVIAESQIDGEFTGWDDNKAYKLLNGDVWKQCSYHYEYKYAAYPDAVIIVRYGSYYMLVEGTECEVECVSGMSSYYQGAFDFLCSNLYSNYIDLLQLELGELPMSTFTLIQGSCADQEVDVVVNAANSGLWAGAGICGAIFAKAGVAELEAACRKYKTPLRDGDAVITPAFGITNAKAIIHAVGPNFAVTPDAFDALYAAYYNSLAVMKAEGYNSISFPLISAGIFGGRLDDAVAVSARQCLKAYEAFVEANPDYPVEVKLCAFKADEMRRAGAELGR